MTYLVNLDQQHTEAAKQVLREAFEAAKAERAAAREARFNLPTRRLL